MKRITHLLLGGALLLCLLPSFAMADNEQSRIFNYFKSLSTYNVRCTREEVFVHLDNNGYFEGDVIWFNANVVYASNLNPTKMSHVLYVELINSDGEIMQRKRLHLENGRAAGEFKLDELVHSGYYEVRAYTRAMLNWDAASVFSRVIPVFSKEKEPNGNFTQLNINDVFINSTNRQPPVAYLPDGASEKKGYEMAFFPEGGNIVGSLPATVAFKLTNTKGVSLTDSIGVYRADGTLVTTAAPEHLGMGTFELPANMGVGAYAKVQGVDKAVFPLPNVQNEGCTLRTLYNDDPTSDSVSVVVSRTAGFPNHLLGISIECRGRSCFFDTLHVAADRPSEIVLEKKVLGRGVNQITLFDADGKILAERRIWQSPEQPVAFDVKQNAKTYKSFQPIVLKMNLRGKDNKPCKTQFSLSVRDQKGELVVRGAGIRENLLLSSDVKGYIGNPSYYFDNDDEAHLHALDLLLMVQGWRRYDWQEMADVKPFVLKQPIESGMLLDGKVVNARKHGLAGYQINVNIFLPGVDPLRGVTTTDSLGNFAFTSPSFFGEGMGVFSTTKDGRRKYCFVALNRRFYPQPRTFTKQELALRPPVFDVKAQQAEPQTFEWQDTIKNDIVLPEAQVKTKGYDDYFSGVYSWGGGEKKGKMYSSVYYNTNEELEAYRDEGEEIPGIWDWLAEKNKHFEYYPNDTMPYYYNGSPAIIVQDNKTNPLTPAIFLDEIKSLMISDDPSVVEKIMTEAVFESKEIEALKNKTAGRRYAVIFIYTDPTTNTFENRKGQRATLLHGYADAAEFYAPNYRKNSMPDMKDFRRTLYWQPNVQTDEQGHAEVTLFSNARQWQKLCITAQGVTNDGQLIDFEQ